MDEKTAELRDIFLSVSDEEMVTESQEDGRGSLTDDSDSTESQLLSVIDQLREKFGFTTEISETKRRLLVERFYDDETDERIADELELDPETVFAARMDLHLIRDEEPALSESVIDKLRTNSDTAPATLADQLELSTAEVQRARAVLETKDRSRRVSQRFRTAFDEIMTDIELTDQYATDAHTDGLDDATEGAETDVDF